MHSGMNRRCASTTWPVHVHMARTVDTTMCGQNHRPSPGTSSCLFAFLSRSSVSCKFGPCCCTAHQSIQLHTLHCIFTYVSWYVPANYGFLLKVACMTICSQCLCMRSELTISMKYVCEHEYAPLVTQNTWAAGLKTCHPAAPSCPGLRR